eukprot:TRINITY_DN2898_c0_g1_i1.p2 TRINITY_DN2898_c0_g1~~TRINITY_DN2898_c0_g1_i1.p2  ORF type:complete len:98 (+),score=45.66 TRINITY_DN2898_c0_g1_i1:293-586(+)
MVHAELPGMKKEDIKIELLENNTLKISGETKQEKKEERQNFHRVERSFGSFERRFTLPDYAKIENITANYNNGILDVVIPKEQAKLKAPAKKQIAIS